MKYAGSVENLPCNLGFNNIRSARYRLPKGSIADLVPRCKVALSVARARPTLIPNLSERFSAVTLLCRSVDTKVGLTGTSSNRSSCVWICSTIRHSSIAKTGSKPINSDEFDLGSSTGFASVDVTCPSVILLGSQGFLLVRSICGQSFSSAFVGTLVLNSTLVPCDVSGMCNCRASIPRDLLLSYGLSQTGISKSLI